MNTPAKLIFPILILLVLGAAVLFFTQGSDSLLPQPDEGDRETQQVQGAGELQTDPGDPLVRQPEPETGRRIRVADENPSGADHPQGVMGRVIDRTSTPLEGIQVYLVESTTENPFMMTQLMQMGMNYYPPVAQMRTQPDGSFALGLQKVLNDKSYELRFTSDRYADYTIPGIRIFPEKWYEADDVILDLGALVTGQVTAIGGTGLPIEGAEVALESQMNTQSINRTPGRERGILVMTDANGRYRIENAPEGSVTISVLKDGFAKAERRSIRIRRDASNVEDFQLAKGLSIAGNVIESVSGEPIADAKITAVAFSSKTPINGEDRSNEDGEFQILGLTDGPYQLLAAAPGFDTRRVPAVIAGKQDQTIVLDRLGAARIKVMQANGSILRNYRVIVRGFFKENPEQLGLVQGVEQQRVRASDLENGVYLFKNLNKGDYIFEVQAQGYAKTHSETFTVALGSEPPLLEVYMQQGGSIEGVVVAADGSPLGGAQVTTMMNSMDENPLLKLFGSLVQHRITKRSIKTDSAGRFRMDQLTPGTYQLKFSHRDNYDLFLKDNAVQEGTVTKMNQVVMNPGTRVWGYVYVEGKASAQVKVTVSRIPESGAGTAPPFMAEAISDPSGRYEINRRLPPGRYQARAARQTLANPLLQIADFQKTQREFTITASEDQKELPFRLQ
ncbi:MAG: MSCRAMM family protein [Planctomycetota bacterium]|jgi:hypothetical protein